MRGPSIPRNTRVTIRREEESGRLSRPKRLSFRNRGRINLSPKMCSSPHKLRPRRERASFPWFLPSKPELHQPWRKNTTIRKTSPNPIKKRQGAMNPFRSEMSPSASIPSKTPWTLWVTASGHWRKNRMAWCFSSIPSSIMYRNPMLRSPSKQSLMQAGGRL